MDNPVDELRARLRLRMTEEEADALIADAKEFAESGKADLPAMIVLAMVAMEGTHEIIPMLTGMRIGMLDGELAERLLAAYEVTLNHTGQDGAADRQEDMEILKGLRDVLDELDGRQREVLES